MEKIDLHIHSTFSDGFNSPEEIVNISKKKGLCAISITDHDNLAAYSDDLNKYAEQRSIELVTGIEMSTDLDGREVHILGYFIDPTNAEINKCLRFLVEERIKRAKRIVSKLNEQNIDITFDEVLEESNATSIGRPHIAKVLVKKKIASGLYPAFNKFLGNHCYAYEKKVHISPQNAIRIIREAGGMSFIAHPGQMNENLVMELIKSGIDGIETLHPSHSKQQVRFYKNLVEQYFLLESGGSDYHGGFKYDDGNIGNFFINKEIFNTIKQTHEQNKR